MSKIIISISLIYLVCNILIAQSSQMFYQLKFEKDTSEVPSTQPQLKELPQDQIIEPDEYILGPGDEISIAIIGPFSQFYSIPISPEGKIYLPQLDVFQLEKNETLTSFKTRLIKFLDKNFQESRFEVFLSRVKIFRVSISGEIEHPGLYMVNGASRLSDLIENAGISEESSLRNIQITNDDKINSYDLLCYFNIGTQCENPYLRQGDKIFVPVNEPRFNKIQVLGAVNKPGIYEYRQGDTIQKLLNLSLGLWANSDSDQIKIARFVSDESEFKEFVVSLSDQSDFKLKPDDRIMVYELNDYREKFTVQVRGEVIAPGYYPIVEGSTTLTQIIQAAGSFTDEASLFQASLHRHAREEIQDPELDRLNKMLASDMEVIEREYWKIRNRESRNLVSVDFINLFHHNNDRLDVELRHGDVINVPKITRNVTVSGAVQNPGIQEFRAGEIFTFYITAAGGLSQKARKSEIQIIKTRTGTWYDADDDISIEEGDIIFVPEKPIRDYWAIFKDTLTVMTQIAALTAIVYNVSR